MFMNKPEGNSSADHVQLVNQKENAETKRNRDRSDKYRLEKKQKQLKQFDQDGQANNSIVDHVQIKKEKKKKDKLMGSIEDGGSIQTSINNVVPPRHKKETGGNSVTIAPLAGNQLVSTNLFTKGKEMGEP